MKKFYELTDPGAYGLYNSKFYVIELDEISFEVKSRQGSFYDYYNDSDKGRKSQKQYKKLETAQRNFDKKCATWEAKGYVLSDPQYPLFAKRAVEEAKETKATDLKIKIFHEKCFEEVVKLKQLTELTLETYGNASDIPDSLTQLKNLEVLKLSGEFNNIPENIGDLKKLKRFQLGRYHNGGITELPATICKCSNLEVLDLYHSSITVLPPNIGHLSNLEELNFGYTSVSKIPESIGECKKLKRFSAFSCKNISAIPPSFAQLKELRVVKFSSCNFTHLPLEICELPKLEELHFENNIISFVPDEIGKLTELQELHLNTYGEPKGKLNRLPDSLFKLKKLHKIDLYYNSFTSIPEGFKDMPALESLDMHHNDFPKEYITYDVLSEGKTAIFRHLGWEKEEDLSVENLLSESEQFALVAQYRQPLETFLKKSKTLRPYQKKEAKRIYEFLTFQSNEIPKIIEPDWYNQEIIRSLHKMMTPLNQWTEIEHRIMLVLTKNNWHKFEDDPIENAYYYRSHNLANCFFDWYKKQIEQNTEPEYEETIELLHKYGKDNNALFVLLAGLHNDLIVDDRISKLGKKLSDYFKEDPTTLLEEARKHEKVFTPLISLLIEADFKTFEKHAYDVFFDDQLIQEKIKEGGYINIDVANIRKLAYKNPKKHEDLLMKAVETPNIGGVKDAQLAIDLHHLYGKKYHSIILKLIEQSIFMLDSTYQWNQTPVFLPPKTEKIEPMVYLDWVLTHYKEEESIKEKILSRIKDVYISKYNMEYLKTVLAAYPTEVMPIYANKLLANDNRVSLLFELLKEYDYSEHYDKVWELLNSKNREKRKLAAKELNRLYAPKEVLAKADELLASTVDKRMGAVQLLIVLNNEPANKRLRQVLKEEENDGIREVLLTHLLTQDETYGKKEALAILKKMADKGRLDKPVKKWLDVSKLPSLHWKNGKKLDAKTINFLFHKQKNKELNWHEAAQEVRPILADIDTSKSGEFAHKLLKLVLENGGIKVANKAFLTFIAHLGDDQIVPMLKKYCIDNQNALSANLLGNMNGTTAARALDAIMLQFKSKYPNVRSTASEGFDRVAQKMGLSRLELMDQMIPDFGFEDLFKSFDVNGETWRVYINSDLKLAYLNELDEIKKSLPTKAPKEVKDAIKAINKEIRSVSKQQKLSLEFNFMSGRRWPVADWQAHFLNKPIPFALAQTLVWGIYEKDQLTETFGINQDQTLENADFDEIELPDNAHIGMIHPIELNKEQIKAWQEYLKDNDINQAFEQINRQLFYPNKKELKEKLLHTFYGEEILGVTFKSFMEKRAWKRGSVLDGGMVDSYRKQYPAEGIEAFIRLENMSVQAWDYDEKTTLEDLFFVKINSIQTGSYVYDTYKDENDERLIAVKDLPALVYSETMYDFTLLIARKPKTEEE